MLRIDKRFHDEMIAHALEDDSIECCGVLAGTDDWFLKLFRMTNVENSPYRFSWDSKELIRVWNQMEDNGWEHRAVYHSHTHSEAYPSSHGHTPRRMAGGLLHHRFPDGQGEFGSPCLPNPGRVRFRGTGTVGLNEASLGHVCPVPALLRARRCLLQ